MATQSRAKTLLLTRPEPQATRFARRLVTTYGDSLRVVISPLMRPRYLQPALPNRPYTALILTSETGAEAARRISAAGQGLPQLAYCVGDRTASVAAACGFQPVSAQGDADALVALIAGQGGTGPLLFLHGAETRGTVAERLNSAGIETDSAVVYDQIACPLTDEARASLTLPDPVLLPLFSPRTARLFADQAQDIAPRAPLWVAALSPAVAAETASLAPERLEIARTPEAESMLLALAVLIVAGQGS